MRWCQGHVHGLQAKEGTCGFVDKQVDDVDFLEEGFQRGLEGKAFTAPLAIKSVHRQRAVSIPKALTHTRVDCLAAPVVEAGKSKSCN